MAAMTSRRKAALALVAMGPDRAAETLRNLPEDTVVDLLAEVSAIGPVDAEQARDVLSELAAGVQQQSVVAEGGPRYTSDLLARTFGSDKAAQLSGNVRIGGNRPFAHFQQADPDDVARVLADESGPTIALVLAHLDPPVAAPIFARLDPDIQTEVGLRLARLDTIHRSVVEQVDEDLKQRIAPLLAQPVVQFDGLDVLVQVVNSAPTELERQLLASMSERDAEMASRVRDALFVFEDVIRLDDRAVQEVLKSVDTRMLAIALKDAEPHVAEKFFKNLSERARENLQEEIDYLQGVKPADQKEARKQVVAVIRKLEEDGTIVIARGES